MYNRVIHHMKLTGLSQTDVQNLSAMFNCTSVSLGDSTEFIKDSHFNGEELFKNTYSQVISAKLKMKSSTAYRLMEIMSFSGENKNSILRKILGPVIAEKMESFANLIPSEKMSVLQFVLQEWTKNSIAADYPETCRAEISSMPVMRITLDEDRVSEELATSARNFLKSIFQMCNLSHEGTIHSPQILDELWENLIPDMGIFSAEICPYSKKLSVAICDPEYYFTILKNCKDHESIINMMLLETRLNKIKNCSIISHGTSLDEEMTIQEIKNVESDIIGNCIFPHELSSDGEILIHKLASKINILHIYMRFPADARMSIISCDLELDEDFFILDGIKVCSENQKQLENVIKKRVLAMAETICGIKINDEKDMIYSKINKILESKEEDIDDHTINELVYLNAAFDYRCSIDSYSQVLCAEIIKYLLSTKEMSFTIPSMLSTLLNCALAEKSTDELLSEVMRKNE